MKSYIKDYPRPQLVRNEWLNLNGSWDFSFDNTSIPENVSYTDKITVPFTYETQLSGICRQEQHQSVWYKRELEISNNEKQVLIHFEGSDYITKLWINGKYVGSHKGGYSRFSFDISDFILDGKNTVIVNVLDFTDKSQPRGKQRWTDENFACWYVQTTGIWKSVWLEYVNQKHIESIKITPDIKSKSVNIEASVNDFENCTLTAAASYNGIVVGTVSTKIKDNLTALNLDIASLKVSPWEIMHWTPDEPNLYDLELSISENGTVIDTVNSYFGMREISIEGNRVLLNGKPIYQRLILDQGYWKSSHLTPPDEQALIDDIDKVMALGYNGVRKHMKIEDERFLYWADVKGLLVWSEFPATYSFTDRAVENFTTEWIEVVKQNYNHPSIITWTPFNESWGVPEIFTNTRQQDFTKGIYYLTKAIDPMRPVICNDGWEHTVSDIITLHDYEETGEVFLSRYENEFDITENIISHNGDKYAFAKGYEYTGQPIIISEFGGIAFNGDNSGWGYGNKVDSKEAFINRFSDITGAIKELSYCCGYCYTQVSDVQQEINGLMTEERDFKIDPQIIKEINLK